MSSVFLAFTFVTSVTSVARKMKFLNVWLILALILREAFFIAIFVLLFTIPATTFEEMITNLGRLKAAEVFKGCTDAFNTLYIDKFEAQMMTAGSYLKKTLDMRWVGTGLFTYQVFLAGWVLFEYVQRQKRDYTKILVE